MKAVVIAAENVLEVREVPSPKPPAGEVLVRLRAAALNHRDLWISKGQYAGIKYPCIPGSDGAGQVVTGEGGAAATATGSDVIIYPGFDWGADPRAQGGGFGILGLPRDGTLAEEVSVPRGQLAPKPSHLTWEEAAALPLAGLTAYRAVFTRARLQPRERVLISGIGGGVAVFALQFAVAAGAEVWVTSSSPEKIAKARALGAAGGFDYAAPGWEKTAATKPGLFDLIIDSAGGEGFEKLIDVAAPGGRIAFYGATRGNPPVLPMRKVFWRQLSLLGSTMGSPTDWSEMVAFVAQHKIKPVVSDVFPLSDAAQAFALMNRGGQFGKIVVKME